MLKYVIEQGLWTWSSRNKEMSLPLKTRHIRGNNFRDHVKLKIIGAANYANCSSELGMQQPITRGLRFCQRHVKDNRSTALNDLESSTTEISQTLPNSPL
jgi:hypothetical protein